MKGKQGGRTTGNKWFEVDDASTQGAVEEDLS